MRFTGHSLPLRNEILYSTPNQTTIEEMNSISGMLEDCLKEHEIRSRIESIFISRQKKLFAGREIDSLHVQVTFVR
jgi:hypothetical protein